MSSDTLGVFLHDSDINQVSWLPLGKNPSPQSPRGTGTLEQAAEKLRGWRLVLIAPSCDILLTEVSIPSKNKQRLLQAAPFALENELTEEIDQLHFAVDHRADQTGSPVAVISRQRLESWLDRFHSLGLQPLALYPDLLCLPLADDHWTLYLTSQFGLLRMGPSQGICIDAENLASLLRLSLGQSRDRPAQLDLYVAPGTLPDFVAAATEVVDCPVQSLEHDGETAALLAAHLDEKHTLNLLQGEYQQVDQKTVQWRRWLPAAALFAVLIGINVFSSALDYANYKSQSLALQNEIQRLFRETFPETKRIVDARVQMEQQLRLLRGEKQGGHASFLNLFSRPALVLAKAQGIQLVSLSFRDNQLDLKLTLKDLQSLEALSKAIEANGGLSVEIKSANATGNQVSSHLRVKRGNI